jgi:hypothetical protein
VAQESTLVSGPQVRATRWVGPRATWPARDAAIELAVRLSEYSSLASEDMAA